MLQGFSSLSCIDNLYRSLAELSPDGCLRSQEFREKLTKPPIAAQFELSSQIFLITASLPVYYYRTYVHNRLFYRTLTTTDEHDDCFSDEMCVPLNLVDPKNSASKSSSCGEFAKGPLRYMVTDDLVVTPMSSFAAISHLNSSNIPVSDVEEKVVRIGLSEVNSISNTFSICHSYYFSFAYITRTFLLYILQSFGILNASLISTNYQG
ncbi:hypothetical protein MtrunA17_Chr2g0292001 [Medicago truncatula]|uniref:DUF674 family protein n=1 Tax=Medicago truncatula TaxID=3880 RepID=A0A396J446_MEDTR|nr:hypothetical protein MtrunA17_Chr2g0292001 [Medicago truncatula]